MCLHDPINSILIPKIVKDGEVGGEIIASFPRKIGKTVVRTVNWAMS